MSKEMLCDYYLELLSRGYFKDMKTATTARELIETYKEDKEDEFRSTD